MKFISPSFHGVIDYAMCGVLLLLPNVGPFAFAGPMVYVFYGLAAGYLLLALLTNMPFGLLKWIPFPVHGALEALSAVAFAAAPWVFGFARNHSMRSLFFGLGVVFLLTFLCTDWSGPNRKEANEAQGG